MTPEEAERLAFELWDTGNRPYPQATEAVLRAYSRGLEEAAKVAETCGRKWRPASVAAAIRALKP